MLKYVVTVCEVVKVPFKGGEVGARKFIFDVKTEATLEEIREIVLKLEKV